jgi:hypothetical protein
LSIIPSNLVEVNFVLLMKREAVAVTKSPQQKIDMGISASSLSNIFIHTPPRKGERIR